MTGKALVDGCVLECTSSIVLLLYPQRVMKPLKIFEFKWLERILSQKIFVERVGTDAVLIGLHCGITALVFVIQEEFVSNGASIFEIGSNSKAKQSHSISSQWQIVIEWGADFTGSIQEQTKRERSHCIQIATAQNSKEKA